MDNIIIDIISHVKRHEPFTYPEREIPQAGCYIIVFLLVILLLLLFLFLWIWSIHACLIFHTRAVLIPCIVIEYVLLRTCNFCFRRCLPLYNVAYLVGKYDKEAADIIIKYYTNSKRHKFWEWGDITHYYNEKGQSEKPFFTYFSWRNSWVYVIWAAANVILIMGTRTSVEYPDDVPATARVLSLGDVDWVDSLNYVMIKVDGGTFMMGNTPEQHLSEDYAIWAEPVRRVTVSTFWIGEAEVDGDLWKAVMNDGDGHGYATSFWGRSEIVHYVSWDECMQFVERLNERFPNDTMEYRLPTEAEWEYAARGGAHSKGYVYSGSDNLDEVAIYYDGKPRKGKTDIFGKRRKANELGLYDMTGNATEWCLDGGDYYQPNDTINPFTPYTGEYRIACGGHAWTGEDDGGLKVSARWVLERTCTRCLLGLRLVYARKRKELDKEQKFIYMTV